MKLNLEEWKTNSKKLEISMIKFLIMSKESEVIHCSAKIFQLMEEKH